MKALRETIPCLPVHDRRFANVESLGYLVPAAELFHNLGDGKFLRHSLHILKRLEDVNGLNSLELRDFAGAGQWGMASLEKTDYKVKVGNRIRKAREAKHLRPVDVCNTLGVSSGKYSQWEGGLSLPRMDQAVELVGALETSLDYIFRGIGAPHTVLVKEVLRDRPVRSPKKESVPKSSDAVPLKAARK